MSQNQTLSDVPDSQPESIPLGSEVSDGAKLVSPQKDQSTLSDLQCSVKESEPSVSKTGRVRRPPGHLKDFVLY